MTTSSDPPKINHSAVTTLPLLLLGPANTLAAIGLPYRWLRDTADRLGVPYVGAGRKRAYRADLVIAALERHGITPESESQPAGALPIVACADPAAIVRALLGKRRAAP